MSIITMNMSDYKIEHDDSMKAECDYEVSGTVGSPALALQEYTETEINRPAPIPQDLVSVDVETFLKRMYAYQR